MTKLRGKTTRDALRRVATASAALLLGGALTAGPAWSVVSTCNDPTPGCTPNLDGTGCCDPDTCTLLAVGATCRDEEHSCKEGQCADTAGGRTCEVKSSGSFSNVANGTDCFLEPPADVCLQGECHSGSCSGIGSAGSGEYNARCPDIDNNPCTIDACNAPGNVFAGCTHTDAPNTQACYVTGDASGGNVQCTPGHCSGAPDDTCVLDGPPVTCPAPAACHKETCDATNGCQSVVAPNGDGATCTDPNPNDCTLYRCSNKGNCVTYPAGGAAFCSPGDGNPCTVDKCSPTRKQCSVFLPMPIDTACVGDNDPCTIQKCTQDPNNVPDGRLCTQYDGLATGTSCATDTNSCTNQTCQGATAATRTCTFDSCATGAGCALCGVAGHCSNNAPTCSCTTN